MKLLYIINIKVDILAFILLHFSVSCYCQDFRPTEYLSVNPHYTIKIKHYSIKQGLPNRGVLDIAQDKNGIIWIGTYDNAYQFDGYQFNPLPKLTSEQSPSVGKIRADSAGNMWFSEYVGRPPFRLRLLKADQQSIIFGDKQELPFSLDNFILSRPNPSVHKRLSSFAVLTNDSELWQYTGNNQFKKIFKSPTPLLPIDLRTTPNGTFLVSLLKKETLYKKETTFTDIVEISPGGQKIRQYRQPGRLKLVWIDSKGELVVQQTAKLYLPKLVKNQIHEFLFRLSPSGKLEELPIQVNTNTFSKKKFDFTEANVTYDAHRQLYWICTRNKLFAWHPIHGIVFDLDETSFPVIDLSVISFTFVDRTGVVWVGTQNGLLTITLKPNRFQQLLSAFQSDSPDTRHSTRGITQIDSKLWVNAHTPQLVDLKTQKRIPTLFNGLFDHNGCLKAHDGNIWIAARNLYKVAPGTLTVEKYPLLDGERNYCLTLWQDGRHNIWLGCEQGLSRFDWAKQQVVPFTAYNQFPELAHKRINGFFPDKRAGGIWLASSAGLYLLDTLRGIVGRYSTRDTGRYYLPFDQLSFVHPDPNTPNLYWLATLGGGLIRLNRATGESLRVNQESGLPNNTLYAIYEDHRNRLWLPSNYGLIAYNKQTKVINNYLPEDGITHEEFNLTSHFRADDGRLYLGGLNGITTFMPDSIDSSEPKRFPLQLNEYQLLDSKTGDMKDHLNEIRQTRQIVLKPAIRSFTLGFAIPDFQYLDETRLWFRITDWQPKWTIEPGLRLKVNGLPAGTYQLQVRLQNTNGQWLSDLLTIPIIVQKPFYQQLWFLLLCGMVAITCTVVLFNWRDHQLQQDKLRLEREVARRTAQIQKDKAIIEQQASDIAYHATMKSRFFTNVTHEFRTPLTLLLGPLSYLQKYIVEPDAQQMLVWMDYNAQSLLKLVNNLLDMSKAETTEIQLIQQPVELKGLIARKVAMFQSQAAYSKVHVTFTGMDQPRWLLLDSEKLDTVLKNLIANAIRFTPPGGNVSVEVNEANGYMHITVRDTGTGIHSDDLPHIFERYYQSKRPDAPLLGGTGIGLALVQDYCRLWKGTLTVDSQLGVGSAFTFTYPIQEVEPPLQGADGNDPELSVDILSPPLQLITASRKPIHILLAEDNYDMAVYLEMLLKPLYTLHIFQNGQLAWDWLTTQSAGSLPHLIISDVMMPQMDGIALLTAVRRSAFRHIPMIILTGRTDSDTRIQSLQLGAADYLTKPFDKEELLTRINNLRQRSREQTRWLSEPDNEPNASPATVAGDETWLKEIEQLILNNLTNSNFQVNSMADYLNISERQVFRKIRELTGLAPNQFVQEIRLQTAYRWIESQRYTTVKEISYAVGFQHVPHFSQLFRQRFGITPSTFLDRYKK